MFGDIGFFDVDRIEVLKGPQGTLYGRNAVGGVINFITSRPTGEFEGYAKARLGNYNSRKLDAAINLPLSPVTNARIAVPFPVSCSTLETLTFMPSTLEII